MPLRRLPALGSLRAFEAAGRLSSFKAAAEELAVTPGAVSQQIRGLEEDLGVKLFTRAPRSVTLTEAGRQLQPCVTKAFIQMRDAVDKVRPVPTEPLRIEASGPVINKWLLPRFHRFTERYPDLSVTIGSGHEERAFGEREVVIRFNQEPGEGVFALKLCEEVLLPLASPDLVERLELRQPLDLIRAPLLHLSGDGQFGPQPGWPDWFAEVGLDPLQAQHGTHFDARSADHALNAAVAGAGVVLGRRFLSRIDMADRRLVAPFGPALPLKVCYFVVCRKGSETNPDIAAFLNWASEESAAMADGAELFGATG